VRRLIFVVMLFVACRHHESPTEWTPGNIMGSMGDASLFGKVLSAEGRPVEGASVVIHRDNLRYGGRTDASGDFKILDIWHGLYTLDVYVATQAAPYMTIVIEVKRLDNLYKTLVLPRGTLPSPGCGYLSGYVTEQWKDTPIAGAQVSFSGMTRTTSEDGFYLFELGCPPAGAGETRTLRFEHPSYLSLNFNVTIQPAPIRWDAHLLHVAI
jgi:carboxypeptidase family protein